MLVFRLIVFSLLIALLSACVATQTFPGVVRAGDTVTLAVGSLDGLDRDNVTVTYYPDSDPSNPVDLTQNVRSVIRIFPDKTSAAYWDTASGNGLETMNFLSTLSGHGPWQSVVAVDLPVTLPTGTGVFRVTPGAGVKFPLTLAKVQNVDIAIEVLASVNGDVAIGENHVFEYRKLNTNDNTNIGNLARLEGLRQAVVSTVPDTSTTSVEIAAAEYSVSLVVLDASQNDVTDQLFDFNIAIVLDDQLSYLKNQTSLIWSRNGGDLKVIVTSATGRQGYRAIRYSILLVNAAGGWSIAETPSINSATYYDTNGDQLIGLPAPAVAVIY